MPKYQVEFTLEGYGSAIVEADSKEEAVCALEMMPEWELQNYIESLDRRALFVELEDPTGEEEA